MKTTQTEVKQPLTRDQEVSVMRSHLNMGHTSGDDETTTFSLNLPDFMHHARYADVKEMIKEIALVGVTGGTVTKCQLYILWMLEDNGVIDAISAVQHINKLRSQGLEEVYD